MTCTSPVSYTHLHITVNTLFCDDEREELIALAKEIAKAGADAVIVQDCLLYTSQWVSLMPVVTLSVALKISRGLCPLVSTKKLFIPKGSEVMGRVFPLEKRGVVSVPIRIFT